MATITVEIEAPVQAECTMCGEVYFLDALTADDIKAMAMGYWICEGCDAD